MDFLACVVDAERDEPWVEVARMPWPAYEVAPGLVVHRRFYLSNGKLWPVRGWNVAHRESGRTLHHIGANTKAGAVALAQVLAPLTDWTQTAAVMRRDKPAFEILSKAVAAIAYEDDDDDAVGAEPPEGAPRE